MNQLGKDQGFQKQATCMKIWPFYTRNMYQRFETKHT